MVIWAYAVIKVVVITAIIFILLCCYYYAASQHWLDMAYCYRRPGLCVSVCLSVGHDREPCKNGGTDRDVVWGVESWDSKNHMLDWEGGAHWCHLVNTSNQSLLELRCGLMLPLLY